MIKKCLLFIGLLFSTISACSASANATLHAIIITDTFDEQIGSDVFEDLISFRAEAKKIAFLTELNLNSILFHGETLVASNIVATLQAINIQPDDAVIFYFSGHGYRTLSKENNPWPDLFLSEEGTGLDYLMLVKILVQKSPRFMLAIADCCNNIIPEEWANTYKAPSKPMMSLKCSHNEIVSYRHLFLESNGLIMIAGSGPGQYSWSTPFGGIYSMIFLDVLHEASEGIWANWDSILELTCSEVIDWTAPFSFDFGFGDEFGYEEDEEEMNDWQIPYYIYLQNPQDLLTLNFQPPAAIQ